MMLAAVVGMQKTRAQSGLDAQQPIGVGEYRAPVPGGVPNYVIDVGAEAKSVLNQVQADTAGQDKLLGAPQIVGRLLGHAMFVLGSVALLVFVYAGIRWMVAIGQGKGESAATAMKIILWAVIGLAIIFMSYIIMTYVLNLLYDVSGAPRT